MSECIIGTYGGTEGAEIHSFGSQGKAEVQKLTLKQSFFSVSFMLLFTISFYLLFDSHVRKQTFFSSHFASIWFCSTCLVGTIFGGDAVLHLDN